jgi:hypothetical protein
MAVHTHSNGDLAALNVLLFMPAGNVSPSDRIAAYKPITAALNVPANYDFPKTLNANLTLIEKAPDQFSAIQKAVDGLITAINAKAGVYVTGVTGNATTVDLIGWGAPGFSIVNQVVYLAQIGVIDRIPAEENKYQELGALNIVVLRNSPDGNATFADFAHQLAFYYAQAQKLSALDPFRVAMEGINVAFTASAPQFADAHQKIATFLTTFQTLSQQGVLDWNSCGFTSLTEIELLANKGLQPRP